MLLKGNDRFEPSAFKAAKNSYSSNNKMIRLKNIHLWAWSIIFVSHKVQNDRYQKTTNHWFCKNPGEWSSREIFEISSESFNLDIKPDTNRFNCQNHVTTSHFTFLRSLAIIPAQCKYHVHSCPLLLQRDHPPQSRLATKDSTRGYSWRDCPNPLCT